MTRKPKTRASKLALPPLQTDDEAAASVASIAALTRHIDTLAADANARISEIAQEASEDVTPLAAQRAAETKVLQDYCVANRDRLTGGGKTKTIEFATGKVSWRNLPAAVKLRDAVDVIIERIKTLKLNQFIRQKEEVDKEAMLKEATLAATIAGVTIRSEGEEFYVDPAEVDLEPKLAKEPVSS